jgi:hypothetical protein
MHITAELERVPRARAGAVRHYRETLRSDLVANTAMSVVITLCALCVLVLQWHDAQNTFAGYRRTTANAHGTTY